MEQHQLSSDGATLALRVYTPAGPPRASVVIGESERTMCVDERCTMVTSAPCSQRAAQMSCAELLAPITTTFLPA